ncbi:hypothetical protein QYF36_007049 [Acer negundo]|nr:hypothetical protein QYF36_007049 [Acer negundo]
MQSAPLPVSFQLGGRSLRSHLVLGHFSLLLLCFRRALFSDAHLSSSFVAFWFSSFASEFFCRGSSSHVFCLAWFVAAFFPSSALLVLVLVLDNLLLHSCFLMLLCDTWFAADVQFLAWFATFALWFASFLFSNAAVRHLVCC